MQWSYRTGGYVDTDPTVSGGTVHVGSRDKHLNALDAKTGASAKVSAASADRLDIVVMVATILLMAALFVWSLQ